MDIDTISYKPYESLLNNNFVIGIQEENYGPNKITLYCNAILFSKKENFFLKKWLDIYSEYFDPNGWCEASIFLPHQIIESLNTYEKNNIKIVNQKTFYYPLYNETDKIFEKDYDIDPNLITLHLWNTFSEKYYDQINDFDYVFNKNTLYSKLLKNIYDKI